MATIAEQKSAIDAALKRLLEGVGHMIPLDNTLSFFDPTGDVLDASATQRGVMSVGTQTLAGAKTFSSLLTAGAGLGVTGNARLSGNLGVGNSAAGTTPGTVVKKIQIFDAAGISLGYIAVYDAIT